MENTILVGLLQNVAILIAFSALYDFVTTKKSYSQTLHLQIVTGIVLGIIGIVLILTPWTFIPGLFFDTRSVMLAISGLFFGSVPTIVAMILTGTFRLYLGGGGAIMGLAVIISSGTIGILWKNFRPDWKKKHPIYELTGLGYAVHIVMLLCTFFLSREIRLQTIENITLSVFLIYPVATVLLGYLLMNRDKNQEIRIALSVSEERWNFAIEGAGDGIWDWNPVTNQVYFSKQWKKMLGYEDHEIKNMLEEWDKRVFTDDKKKVYEQLEKHIKGETSEYISEHRLLCKNGTYKWILDRGKIMKRDEAGNPLRFIGTHTDISQQKLSEERIQKLNDELEQKVIERTNELLEKNEDLKKLNQIFVGRELRMIELKNKIQDLENKLKLNSHESR